MYGYGGRDHDGGKDWMYHVMCIYMHICRKKGYEMREFGSDANCAYLAYVRFLVGANIWVLLLQLQKDE